MITATKRLYEGLFLVDSGEAAADWDGINDTIEKIIARGDGQIVTMKKWDERKLAYDINGKSKGTYILTYFQGDPAKIAAIERTVQLSERIMRVLIIRTDKMSKEDIEKAPPEVTETTKTAAEPARADSKTRAARFPAAKTERKSRARVSKKKDDEQKPKRTKAKASRPSSAKRSRGTRGARKSAREQQGSAESKSGQAKE